MLKTDVLQPEKLGNKKEENLELLFRNTGP
jgi:hypothetical protein